MDTRLSKWLTLALLLFSVFSSADVHICWQEPNQQLNSPTNTTATGGQTGTSSNLKDFASNYPYLFSRLKKDPDAYAVWVDGNYSASGESVSDADKPGLVAAALNQRGYGGYTCMMFFKGDKPDVMPTSAESPQTPVQQEYQDLINDMLQAMERSLVVLEPDDEYSFSLTLASYNAIKPSLRKIKSIPEMPADANSGASRTATVVSIYAVLHAIGVTMAFMGDPSLITGLIFFDIGVALSAAYSGPISTMLVTAAAASAKAALYTATLASFIAYLSGVVDEKAITIDKNTFSKTYNQLSWEDYKGKANGYIADEESVKDLVQGFIDTLSRLPVGKEIVIADLAKHPEFLQTPLTLTTKLATGAVAAGESFMAFMSPTIGIPIVITTQAAFNFILSTLTDQPLSRILFPGTCTSPYAFSDYPLEHICYQLKRGALDYPGYIGPAIYVTYQVATYLTWLARHKVHMD